MLISVVIPAYNEAKFLQQTLERIQRAIKKNEREGITWELIVCHNNSTDGTAVIGTELGSTVIFEPINQISRARNTGASTARGEWLLFIDADSYPTPDLMAEPLDVIRDRQFIGSSPSCTVIRSSPPAARETLAFSLWDV